MGMPYIIDRDGIKREHPMRTKERPKCRKVLEKYCVDNDILLEGLWLLMKNNERILDGETHSCLWSKGLISQCRKMLWEEQFK